MIFHDVWGKIYEVGDFVKHRKHRGEVVYAQIPYVDEDGDLHAGYYNILTDEGTIYVDYHFAFETDVERIREERLKELGIKNE